MLDRLEALHAFARERTMSRAALSLRLTQSAVSKRIAALEAETRLRLVERSGRASRLTAAGRELLARTEPLLAQLRDAVASRDPGPAGRVTVGVSESVLASWGADVLARARDAVPGLVLEFHAHRSPVALEHVRAGEHDIALVAAGGERCPDLVVETVALEELVVVGLAGRGEVPRTAAIEAGSIEPSSATGRFLGRALAAMRRGGGPDVRVGRVLESYAALVRTAQAGFGPAIVPAGIAAAMGVAPRGFRSFPDDGLFRTVVLAARKTSLTRPPVAAFRDGLRKAIAAVSLPWLRSGRRQRTAVRSGSTTR